MRDKSVYRVGWLSLAKPAKKPHSASWKKSWVSPASGPAAGSAFTALFVWHQLLDLALGGGSSETLGIYSQSCRSAGILQIPLSHFLEGSSRGQHIEQRGAVRFAAPHFAWQGTRVWGATSMILAELAVMVAEASTN